MRNYKWIIAWLVAYISCFNIYAQDVVVTVAPTQSVLPPQVLLYLTDPGKYFNITLTNTTPDVQQVYIAFQIEQVEPAGGLSLTTPPHRQPQVPFTIQPNSYYQLSMMDMKRLFDHIPPTEVSVPEGLFTDYANGSFGLLPEGLYQIQITAYKWRSNPVGNPIVVSNPAAGIAMFNVCYKAQSPDFLTPSSLGTAIPDVAEIDPLNAQFTWTQPVITCGSNFSNYNYDFRVVELLDGQYPDFAIDNNPIVYQSKGLMTTMCMIPVNVITSKFNTNSKYVAQVTATAGSGNPLNYVLIENGGKSSHKVFRIKTNDEPQIELPPLPDAPKEEEEEDEPDDDEDEDFIAWGKTGTTDSICTDSLYTFRNPTITDPQFLEISARKLFVGADIKVKWNKVWHVGGEGLKPDTLQFEYDVQLFNGGTTADREAALQTEPIYTKHFSHNDNMQDSILWSEIESKIEKGDYLVLRVKPTCVKGESVAFTNDSVNVIDFAMVESLSKNYFQCSNMVEIHNLKPIDASAKDLKGKEVMIGEYLLTIDDIKKGDEADTWEGKGRVEWNPLGTTVMVCVKFSKLKINTDYVVFAGEAVTYAEDPASDAQVVEQLFSDWGIDNLIADTGIPYAEYLQSAATDGVKDLAKKIDLSTYYAYVKKGQQAWNLLGSGNIDELFMPVAIPPEVNKSPVDLQITTMKFTPTYATMDLIGQFVLPNTQYTKNDILVLGAPRLCISPDNIIPESGTVALLSDFTILDPKSSYEMTFNAPENVLAPQDGCYIAWHNYKFEIFGIDVDMKIPGLKKDIAGVAIDEQPNLKIICSFSEWEDWLIDNVTIDPFQAEDLPGWTFTATDIIYDHSLYRNAANQEKFPAKYDKSKVLIDGQANSWQGLYIKNISVKMPKSLEFGDTQDRRFAIEAKNMFFDKSGVTLDVESDNLFAAKTGKAGGWSFSLDEFDISFIQNDFTKCSFGGTFDVPLVDSAIEYDCQILKVNDDENSVAGNYAYIFKTQQIEDVNFDFLLATATIDKDLSYMLIEAVPEDKLVTRVELLLSGDLDIGGKEYLEEKMKSGLNMTFDIPGVHFSKMRIANCDKWESQFDDVRKLQTQKDNTKIITSLAKDKQFKVGENFYFNTGDWSLASEAKTLGPFAFSLDEYNFDFKNDNLSVSLVGTVKLIEGIDLSATAGITIKAGVTGLQEMDFSKIGFSDTPTVEFDKADFNTSFAGMTISGKLDIAKEGDSRGKGYQGSLLFTMPGDLFKVDATGGYFELDDYTWGYFHIALGSATGLQITPIVINDISGGFYFNCVRDSKDKTQAVPQKGVIGVIAGLGLSTTAGKDMLNGTFEMTVVYDKNNDRLSTMMFTGHLEAASGMVDADASIVYHHDNSDQYFALNITVDAKADGGGIQKGIDNLSKELADMQKELNSGFKEAVSNATGGLSDKIADKSKTKADKQTEAKQPQKPKVCETSVALDFRVTMKENGKKLDNVKWHVYLGQPDEDKRCHFTLIDFKSPIVSVNIGANAYLCIGNELPNNGELPPIPEKIRTFLNGAVKGEGVQSDDISQAENARTAALASFKADSRGGVMLGASAWGYVDVDLGLFYGSMGVLAGFDMALRKMDTMNCMNLPGTRPGYNGWYGEGQLYAYLYAKFGIYVNLGFWEKKLPIIDSEIGGVLRMGGPNPTYFTGKARVRVRLLAGLVNVDRKFEFECGDRCDLFLGNALDGFKLFGECSLGDTIQSKGWDKKNAINPRLLSYPTFDTEAPIDEHFRVLDETELNRIAADYNGDKEDLKAQASRTFIFKNYKYVILYEYDSPNGRNGIGRYYTLKGKGRFRHTINIALNLNPNKYYKLVVQGEAKEIEEGREVDPLNWNENTHRYENKQWWQTKTFYFCTGPNQSVEDCPDLQEHVAIAYPSDCNKLVYHNESKPLDVYVKDLRCPNLALYSDLSKDCFKNGTLKWTLYNHSTRKTAQSLVRWNVTDSTCNITPASHFSVAAGTQYRLKLIYCQSKQNNGKIVADTTTLVDLDVYAINGQWEEGGYATIRGSKSKYAKSSLDNLPYEKPFVGIRIDKIYYQDTPPLNTYSDKRISEYYGASSPNHGQWRFFDPYMYISYLSNFAFVGGWELTNARLKINATTSQSLIYTDKGGSYEGACGSGTPYRITSEYSKVKSLSIFDRNQWVKFCSYPLPMMTESKYYYVNGSLERASKFTPAADNVGRAKALILDLKNVYLAAQQITTLIEKKAKEVQNLGGETFTSAGANRVEKWAESLTGTYLTATYGDVKLEVPYYQFAILWGSQFENSATQGKVTMHKTFSGFTHNDDRVHEFISEQIWIGNFVGKGPISQKIDGRYKILSHVAYSPNYNAIAHINLSVYRVNAYNFKKAEYTYVKSIDRSTAPISFNIAKPLTKF